jgi:nanoRNase/pAp phosphatase (c-di-AMP/oligoRNAs hydrolase)
LMSFLLLQRFMGRGKGVAIRSFPSLDGGYFRKVEELKPDYIFILDKPLVSEEFLEQASKNSIPVVWIDHHDVKPSPHEGVYYYNPFFTNHTHEPVSYLCYVITGKKEDLWLAVIGSISDAFIPDVYTEFLKQYPELGKKEPLSAFDILYTTGIGDIARTLDFALKDSTTHVVEMLKFMMQVKGPHDIMQERTETRHILSHYKLLNSAYQKLIMRARTFAQDSLLYFQYGGAYSFSSNISNQLQFEFPDTVIVVVYVKDSNANISLRGKNVLPLTLKALKGIEGATGGGHQDATGAKLNADDVPQFKKRIEALLR